MPQSDPEPLIEPGPLDEAALMHWAERTENIDEMIHPEHGLFMVHNIGGSVPSLEWVPRWPTGEDTMLDTVFDPLMGLQEMRQAPSWPDLYRAPGTDGECDTGSEHLFNAGDPTDWVLDVHLGMREPVPDSEDEEMPPWISEPYDQLEPGALSSIGYNDWDADKWAHLQVLTSVISRGAQVQDVDLYFGVIDEAWYLVGLNAYDDACG